MALYALLVPNFGGFDYYFMLDVVGITQFQYSMISVLHYFCMFIGSYLFKRWLKDFEVRTLTIVEVFMGLLCAPFTMMFVTRYNLVLGISDGFIIIFTDIIGDIFSMCLVVLPICVLFTKICPRNIEATCFALLAGLYNFKNSIRGYIGTCINMQLIGVSRDNMDDFWKLKVISLVCSCLPLLFIFLLPSRGQIQALQKRMAEEEELEVEAQKKKRDAADDEGEVEDSDGENLEDNLSLNHSSPTTSCIPRGEPLETVYSDLSGEDDDEVTEFFAAGQNRSRTNGLDTGSCQESELPQKEHDCRSQEQASNGRS